MFQCLCEDDVDDSILCGWQDACQHGRMNVILFLIKKGVRDFYDGMIYACLGGHLEIVKLMIEKQQKNGKSPFNVLDFNEFLHWACWGGNLEIVKLIIENGAILKDGYDSAHIHVRRFIAEKLGDIEKICIKILGKTDF